MPPIMKQYYAFISYKRDDQKWAEWLQEKLEHYKLPSNLNGRDGLPKEIRPVFRDKSELAAGVLADEIQKALDHSKYLIVICSPHSAKSEWVNKEVQSFIDSGRTDKIIPFIIEGTPNSGNDETECFPKAIRELSAEDELLGVNINEMGRDAAAVKVVAQMFGLRFDDLWQRHEREKKRRRHLITAGITAFAIAVICVAGWIWHQNVVLKQQRWQMLESQSKLVSEMVKMNAKDDSYLARLAALEVLPKDVSNPVDRPYTAEAERALREASKYGSAVFKIQDALEAIFTPDDEQILVRLLDSTLRFIAVNTGCVTKTIKRDYVSWDLCYSPCGKHIISHNQKDVFILDAQTLATELSFVVDTANIYSAKYSPDGNKIITTSGHCLKIWDAETGDCLKTIVSKKLFLFATYSPDGKYIAVLERENEYSYDLDPNSIIVYNSDNYKVKRVFTKDYIEQYLVFTNDGNAILLPYYESEILDIETGDTIIKIKTDPESRDLCFSPDGEKIMGYSAWIIGPTGDNYKTIKIWNAETGDEIKTLYGHSGFVYSARFSHNGSKVVSISQDMTIRLWDIDEIDKSDVLIRSNERMYEAKINPELGFATNSDEGCIKIWDIGSGKETNRLSYDKYCTDVVFTPDGKRIIASLFSLEYVANSNSNYVVNLGDGPFNADRKIVTHLNTYDIDSGCLVKSLIDSVEYSHLKISPDGKKLIFKASKEIRLMDIETDSVLWSVELSDSYWNFHVFFAFSPDCERVAITPDFLAVKILDANTGIELMECEGKHKDDINDIQFSPDGKIIVACSDNNTIWLWDAETGKSLHTINEHTNCVNSVGFSPDGKYIVSSSKDETIRVWDVKEGICVMVLKIKESGCTIQYVCFSSDGRKILYVLDNYNDAESSIRQYDFPPLQDLIDQTRERFKNRPLTEEERKMYYLE